MFPSVVAAAEIASNGESLTSVRTPSSRMPSEPSANTPT
jgi:hypothetical protein